MAIAQLIARTMIARFSTFERKVDRFRNVLNAALFVKIGRFIRVVNVQRESSTKVQEGEQSLLICLTE